LKPRFVKKYADVNSIIKNAVIEFAEEVKSGKFPSQEHRYD